MVAGEETKKTTEVKVTDQSIVDITDTEEGCVHTKYVVNAFSMQYSPSFLD